MDPDASLRQIRKLADEIVTSGEANETAMLAELILGLDAWICQGGFLPSDWSGENLTAD